VPAKSDKNFFHQEKLPVWPCPGGPLRVERRGERRAQRAGEDRRKQLGKVPAPKILSNR